MAVLEGKLALCLREKEEKSYATDERTPAENAENGIPWDHKRTKLDHVGFLSLIVVQWRGTVICSNFG